jgi:propanediol dehydratase small subunit
VIFRRGHRARWPGVTILTAAVAATLVIAACGRPRSDPQPNLSWTLDPAASVVGPAVLRLQIQQQSGPVAGATLKLEAHMSHAGMAPVLATAIERAAGLYEVPFTFTMPGDWVLLVSGVLPDGVRIERRIDVANVRPTG